MVSTRSGRNAASNDRENGGRDGEGRAARVTTRSRAMANNSAPSIRRNRRRAGREQPAQGAPTRSKRRRVEPSSARNDEPTDAQEGDSLQSNDQREIEPMERNSRKKVVSQEQQLGDAVEGNGGDYENTEGDGDGNDGQIAQEEECTEQEGPGEQANRGEEQQLREGSLRPSRDEEPSELVPAIVSVAEDDSHHVVHPEIQYKDMNGKSRSLSTELASFIVPFPDTTPPPSLVHFVALYIIRNEARRVFPREIATAWLMDFFVSTCIQKFKDQQQPEDEGVLPFPLTEHERSSFLPLLKRRYLLFPFFAGSKYSLVVIEDLGPLVNLLETLMELEANISMPSTHANDSLSLAQRMNRFERALPLKTIQRTAVYHIDWPGSTHDEYRPSIMRFLVHVCLFLVENLKNSCSITSLTAFLDERVDLHARYMPDPPESDHESAWKVIQYSAIMVQGPCFNPMTGKPAVCERESLLYGKLESSKCGDMSMLRNVAERSVSNMQSAKESPHINPYPGLWGGFFESLTRDISEPLIISSTIHLSNCLPVVLEFALKALDDLVEYKRPELIELVKEEGSATTMESEDLTAEMKNSLWNALLREKACIELLTQFQTHVRITRPGKKSKGRLLRFWKSVFDHVMTLPLYSEAANVFCAMRKFPDSVTVCLGLDYLHSKEHRLFFYQATTPNLRQGERPWKLFDYSSKNFSRPSQWFDREAWSRMHEAGVILFAITETIMRCVVSRGVKTEAELVSLLRSTILEKEDSMSSVMTCPVHLRDVVHHERKKRESLEDYKKRVVDRIEDATEAAKNTMACASDAFKRALVPFGSAYGVKRGTKGQNVALCKLRTIPDNMLDLLWENVTTLLQETLTNREQKGEFRFDADERMEVEAQLIRLFRVMNTMFVDTADSLLKDKFLASKERLRVNVSSYASREGAGKRLKKLQAIPSCNPWNYVDTRYSSGYLSSATMTDVPKMAATVHVDDGNVEQMESPVLEVSPLQALSLEGIASSANVMDFMKRDSLTILPDTTLAMRVEPIPYVDLSKADLGWGLVNVLGCILQKIPGHTRNYSCRRNQRLICPPSGQPSNACVELAQRMAEHVFKVWADGYGADALESQSVFTRFDAVLSAALQITSCDQFWCRPSIDASLCYQRFLRNEGRPEWKAFAGYPSTIAVGKGPFQETLWRAVVAKAQIQRMAYPLRRMQVDTPSEGDKHGKTIVNAVDFLNLSNFDFEPPEVYKVDLRYLLQTPESTGERLHDNSGELCFQPGDVFWFSMILSGPVSEDSFIGTQGYSGTHLGVMMEPARTITDKNLGGWLQHRDHAIAKEQAAAIIFSRQEGNSHEGKGFQPLLEKVSSNLRVILNSAGQKMINLIPSGMNIQDELLTYRVTFRRSHLLPRAVNLSSIHPRLLQMHTQFVLSTLHRHSTVFDRRKGLSSGESQQERLEEMQKRLCGDLEELYPRLNPEQLNAIAMPLLWAKTIERSFFTETGEEASVTHNLFSGTLSKRDMNYIGANVFFVRGPPGTGKSYVISAMIDAALFGYKAREDGQETLPMMIKRVLVITHTNTAVDDILVKISKARSYKKGEVVRVGVRGKDPRTTKYNVRAIMDAHMTRQREEYRRRGNRAYTFRHYSEFDIVEDASIVCSTFGSLKRVEFTSSHKPFDMVIVEEAGKLHDGDLLSGLSLAIGMKKPLVPASPLPIIFVGDEQQLPPHSRVDPNLKFPRLCPAAMFERYVTKCEKFSGKLDMNYPVTLLTQHRAHRAIADIHSHFAYKGVIQTGIRESLSGWNGDEMDKSIMESKFKFRTVSIVSYRGSIHGDVRGPPTTGGNTNGLECELIVNVCEDWFYQSQKFLNRVAVLSPYSAQVEKIRDQLRARSERQEYRGMSTIKVYTVDSSQGIESDIIFVSLVRTHGSQRQAFLDNPNRINVLVSRAKERLIIIGARDEICSISPNWDRFYKIVDALALEEKVSIERSATTEEDEAVETVSDKTVLNYGFYDAMSSSSLSGPRDNY